MLYPTVEIVVDVLPNVLHLIVLALGVVVGGCVRLVLVLSELVVLPLARFLLEDVLLPADSSGSWMLPVSSLLFPNVCRVASELVLLEAAPKVCLELAVDDAPPRNPTALVTSLASSGFWRVCLLYCGMRLMCSLLAAASFVPSTLGRHGV